MNTVIVYLMDGQGVCFTSNNNMSVSWKFTYDELTDDHTVQILSGKDILGVFHWDSIAGVSYGM